MSGAGGFLTHHIRDIQVLYASYMPHVKGGGIFLPTKKAYELGDELFVALNFLEDPQRYGIGAKVCWVSPKGAQGGKPQGIGVQFIQDEQQAKRHIEQLLAGNLSSSRQTFTM